MEDERSGAVSERKERETPKKRFTKERIAVTLHQADAGAAVGCIGGEKGVADATVHRGKQRSVGMDVTKIR